MPHLSAPGGRTPVPGSALTRNAGRAVPAVHRRGDGSGTARGRVRDDAHRVVRTGRSTAGDARIPGRVRLGTGEHGTPHGAPA
ncbi:hypothetical protein KBZ10_07715 [Streptomyces sp. F63]|uniref:hypothetical protein n=1 Tax=Streptomyces sp. F63 TaxID=2824887 RepID=UPI001B3898FB|nr:hypothetical protein [Streptomyces sp. F63]MBQ0984408.1 hypothetical protein [Streptomyces sp. F63]